MKIQKSNHQCSWTEVVTAGDIIADSDLEIFNPELHIATLEENATLVMEINIARGRGYVPADQNKTESMPIAVIPVDSIYTPVRKVNFTVENTRVGQVTTMTSSFWKSGLTEASLPKKEYPSVLKSCRSI